MLLTPEELLQSSQMDPQIQAFLAATPMPPFDWNDYQAVRAGTDAMAEQMAQMAGPAEPTLIEEYRDIPMRDGFSSKIKIHRPAQPPATGSPLIVAYFGGGWVSGGVDQGTTMARAYVRLFGATVVAPDYRLAPEHKFPAAQYDAWDSLKWLDEHASEIGADPSQGFIVSGVSAGGGNTAVVVTHAIEDPLKHPITGQYMCVPSLMDEDCVPEKHRAHFLSRQHNQDVPVLPAVALDILAKHTAWDVKSSWRYPVLSKAPMAKQPPAYIQVDGMDPLRDDGLIYEEMLKEAGVKTRLDFYPGCPHAHFAFAAGTEIANRAIADQMVGVGWLLGKTITPTQGLGALAPASVA